MAYKGIDVSHHQGNINWSKVKNSGVDFVILRMGYGTAIDKKFIQYYKNAKNAGLAIGGYWFSYALNESQALSEAAACLKLLKSYPMQLPIFYDFEDDTERYAKDKGVIYTKETRTSIVKTFCTVLTKQKQKTGIYTNPNYIAYLFNWAELRSFSLWIAKWIKSTTTFTISPDNVTKTYGTPIMWQFSRVGKVDGINTDVDLDYWYGSLAATATTSPTITSVSKYTANDLTFRKLNSFRIEYLDAAKNSGGYSSYINAGFFGNYSAENRKIFTLPSANLVCDVKNVTPEGQPYLSKYISNKKLFWTCGNNHSSQFRGKKVSTLIIPRSGKPYVADVVSPPADCLYAISGVPAVRNGDDVDYYNYVKPQGWDESCMGAAYRNWIGIRNGELWLISGKTTKKNYIYGMEFWNKVKNENFDDIITLDGGGSYFYKDRGAIKKTLENRKINNIIVFT